MFRALRASFAVCLCAFAILGSASQSTADPTIWTGPDVIFSKASGADPTLAANQDRITDDVWITRGSSQGIFNASSLGIDCSDEGCFYSHNQSPAGTEWATAVTSPDQSITATNWAALTFTDWENAYGGSGSLQFNITNDSAVVHLLADDIYLNLKFSSWDGHGVGGAFTYARSTAAAVTTPTGDYNGDGVVDAADYVLWRDTLGQSVANGTGADGNANGIIDSGDYDFWKMKFGNAAPGAGGGAGVAAAVPEPTACSLALAAVAIGLPPILRRKHRVSPRKTHDSMSLSAETPVKCLDIAGNCNDNDS